MSGRTLAFYAPENAAIASRLGIPTNLASTQGGIVVSEVEVRDDNTYINVLDQSEPW